MSPACSCVPDETGILTFVHSANAFALLDRCQELAPTLHLLSERKELSAGHSAKSCSNICRRQAGSWRTAWLHMPTVYASRHYTQQSRAMLKSCDCTSMVSLAASPILMASFSK